MIPNKLENQKHPMKRMFPILATLSLAASLAAQSPEKPEGPQMLPPEPPTENDAASNTDPAAVQAEMQSLLTELQNVSDRILVAQEKARQDEEVQKALTDYGRTLRDEMLKISPEQEEAIEQKNELLEEIVKEETPEASDAEAQAAYQEKIREYQRLRQELAAVESKAVQTPAVQEKQEAAQQAQINKMKELEPDLMKLVQQRNEISRRLGELRMRLQRSSQSPTMPESGTGS